MCNFHIKRSASNLCFFNNRAQYGYVYIFEYFISLLQKDRNLGVTCLCYLIGRDQFDR
jgi:hypothetical protein